MRKLILLLLLIPIITTGYAQRVYFSTGTNFSRFNFYSPTPMSTPLQSGTGSNYEMGVSLVSKFENLSYCFGINLNEYNALAGNFSNSYTWNTKFLGFQNSLEFSVAIIKNFRFIVQGGLNLSSIVYGKQSINGAYFDLIKQKEFSGICITPYALFSFSVPFKDLGYLSLGYGINKSVFSANSSQNLSITTNQIRFGFHYKIN